jgi:hypothetical protein
VSVPGEKQRPGVDSVLIAGVAERRPTKAIVVLGIEVGYQLDIELHSSLPRLCSIMMVRVRPEPALAATQSFHTVVEERP